ncbi:hypothetical protein MP228_011467 [Amoeboaphelidium protococcarum]|nr:hypothetical protein MP228_011467 [Amoeboaphelidium protococcarum]
MFKQFLITSTGYILLLVASHVSCLPQDQHALQLMNSPMVPKFYSVVEEPDFDEYADGQVWFDQSKRSFLLSINIKTAFIKLKFYTDDKGCIAMASLGPLTECVYLPNCNYDGSDFFAGAHHVGSTEVDGISVDQYDNVNFMGILTGTMYVSNKDQSNGIKLGDFVQLDIGYAQVNFSKFQRRFRDGRLRAPVNPKKCVVLDDVQSAMNSSSVLRRVLQVAQNESRSNDKVEV